MQLTTRTEGLAGFVRSSRTVAAGLAIVAIVALVAVFMLDRATGAAPVQHLYYVPIILAGLVFRMPGGVLAGVTAILMYHVANPHMLTFRYEESDLIQILLFLAVGITTARLTDDADRLRRLALTDDLTGLHNLRSFEVQLLGLVQGVARQPDSAGPPGSRRRPSQDRSTTATVIWRAPKPCARSATSSAGNFRGRPSAAATAATSSSWRCRSRAPSTGTAWRTTCVTRSMPARRCWRGSNSPKARSRSASAW